MISRQHLIRALHLFVLASLVTAPVLLVADAQFFIGRGASAGDVVAVALILVLAAPAAIAGVGMLATAAGPRLGWAVHLVLVGALASLLVSEALYSFDWPLELQAPLVVAAGVAAAAAYARLDQARSLVSALAPLPFIVLGFVLFISPVSGLIFAGVEEVEAAPDPDARAPVVMVVFDELPGYALMNQDHRLDAARFPSFAALGEDGVWYRNATTSRSDTELAVPTLATGSHAALDSLPTPADHPRSLFTLLAASHRMHVSEPWTNICPESLCAGRTESLDEGDLGSILATIPSILGYVSLPDAERIGIPSPQESGAPSRRLQVETFIEEIEPASGPAVHFLHVLLPHKAWRYLPSGKRYPDAVGGDTSLGGFEQLGDDRWLALQYQQRFLLQLRYTDRLLGDLLEQLRQTGLYERSLIVVTADHGVSFRAGDARRDATASNAPDILSVPLLVKLPHQRDGRVDDRAASTVDVLPTIADAIGAELPWSVDGQSLLGEPPSDPQVEIENLAGGEVELTPAEFAGSRDEALERQIDSFGDGETSLYAVGPRPGLIGRPVDPLLGEPAPAEATIVDGESARAYEPDSELVPARIAGPLEGLAAKRPLAVALNGRIAATTFSYQGNRGVEFSAMVAPSLLREGDNELAVLTIEATGQTVALRPVELSW